MSLRSVAAGAARAGAGLWQGVAEVIDAPPSPAPVSDSASSAQPDPPSSRTRADAMVESGEAMLVPIDSWTRMVDQLANLHDAGQQLAEARERAAKAETEASFLKEQLAEAKQRSRPSRSADRSDAAKVDSEGPERGSGGEPRRPRTGSWLGR